MLCWMAVLVLVWCHVGCCFRCCTGALFFVGALLGHLGVGCRVRDGGKCVGMKNAHTHTDHAR